MSAVEQILAIANDLAAGERQEEAADHQVDVQIVDPTLTKDLL